MVAEGSMRLMRSVSRTGWVTGDATVLMLTVLSFSWTWLLPSERRLGLAAAVRELVSYVHFLTKFLRDQFGNQAFDGSAKLRDLAHQARTQVRILFGRHHEHRLQPRLEFAVHQRHLEFVFVVADGANPAQDGARLDAQRVVHRKAVEGVDRHVVKALGHRLQHLAAVGHAEQRIFLRIAQNGDHQFVEDLAATLDQVEMAVGRRIERSGIDGFNALHRGLF